MAGLTLNGGTVQVANASSGSGPLGFYRIIQYAGEIQGSGVSSLVLPATQDNIAYTLDTTEDPGFIDLHRGFLGDANDDGTVNFADFVLLSNNYSLADKGWDGGDFNNDGLTNFADFVVLSNHYGLSIDGAAFTATPGELAAMSAWAASGVPEPASLSILAGGVVVLLLGKRRGGVARP
jgi:hypothetical protein